MHEADKQDRAFDPSKISSYFRKEWAALLIVAITGTAYNVGLLAGPWFEGQLAQTLCDILGGSKEMRDMAVLAVSYMCAIFFVQFMRYLKRFYVRRFANNVSRRMKRVLYGSMVRKSRPYLMKESVGGMMTKAVQDVDTCVEGMRKFTTELFDTGVALAAYTVMLFLYDWHLALIGCLFPPLSYLVANRMKGRVELRARQYKESAGRLNAASLDRISGAMTYRVLGCEKPRDEAYEACLSEYEQAAAKSGVLETALMPLYRILSMISVFFIVWLGVRNVQGTGFKVWDIAAFTTFLSCFTKLATKSSHAAKLFNAVQKARVSWQRVKPWMEEEQEEEPEADIKVPNAVPLTVSHLSFAYPGGEYILKDISFSAQPGEIIGVTGPVACGKSTLGKVFLCEYPYVGSVRLGEREIADMNGRELFSYVSYQGHDPELMSDTVEENVLLGGSGDCRPYLRDVHFYEEIMEMPDGIKTQIGSGGVRLSGGQQARVALARTMYYKKPLVILDDPFSALDRRTEAEVFKSLRDVFADDIVILISHRLYAFPELDRILWMDGGRILSGTHEELMNKCPAYRHLYEAQTGGAADEE